MARIDPHPADSGPGRGDRRDRRRRQTAGIAAGALAVAVLAMGLCPAFAHPNIVMTCRVLFNFDGPSVDGLGEVWTFDQTFSAELLKDFDTDGDGRFSNSEAAAMQSEIMRNLADSRDFTYVSIDGKDAGKLPVSGFRAEAKNGVVSIAFGVPLKTPLDPRIHTLSVEIKDPEFFVFASFADDNPVLMRGDGAEADGCVPKLVDDSAGAYFGGAIIPEAATLSCGSRPR